jgi:hypothetical protein
MRPTNDALITIHLCDPPELLGGLIHLVLGGQECPARSLRLNSALVDYATEDLGRAVKHTLWKVDTVATVAYRLAEPHPPFNYKADLIKVVSVARAGELAALVGVERDADEALIRIIRELGQPRVHFAVSPRFRGEIQCVHNRHIGRHRCSIRSVQLRCR